MLSGSDSSAHLDDPDLPMSLEEQLYVFSGVATGLSRPERIAQLRAWADKHLPADTRQDEQAAKATIRQNAKFAAMAIPDVDCGGRSAVGLTTSLRPITGHLCHSERCS